MVSLKFSQPAHERSTLSAELGNASPGECLTWGMSHLAAPISSLSVLPVKKKRPSFIRVNYGEVNGISVFKVQ